MSAQNFLLIIVQDQKLVGSCCGGHIGSANRSCGNPNP